MTSQVKEHAPRNRARGQVTTASSSLVEGGMVGTGASPREATSPLCEVLVAAFHEFIAQR
jgi:hypothetical protein